MGRPPAKPAPRPWTGACCRRCWAICSAAPSRRCSATSPRPFSKAGEALTPGEFGLLVLVDRNAGLSQMALARALGIDRSTLVPILDRLQARGC